LARRADPHIACASGMIDRSDPAHSAAMKKPSVPRAPGKPAGSRPPAVNSRLNAQTRQQLVQHYRAKHGVR
jgi:hypothetical protein